MYLFFNKFGVLFQGRQDSDLTLKFCKRSLVFCAPTLESRKHNSRNCVAKVEIFVRLLKTLFLQDILLSAKIKFLCVIILAISNIYNPCFNPIVI